LVLLTDSTMVQAKELLRFLPTDNGDLQLVKPFAATVSVPLPPIVRDYQAVQSHSAEQLQQAMQAHGGNQSRAAQSIGLTARQFGYRLRKLRLPDAT
jgi:Nif-specific regulatory protein